MAIDPNNPNQQPSMPMPGMVTKMAKTASRPPPVQAVGHMYDPGYGQPGGSKAPDGFEEWTPGEQYDWLWGSNGDHDSGLNFSRPVDSPKELLRVGQNRSATDFRSNIPNMQREMGESLKVGANQGLSAANRGTNQQMSSRGLLNSNLNLGAQAGNRSKAQAGVAQGTADINAGLISAADTMDAQAIDTGMQIQQTQQQIQDQIYSQAMAKMNSQNSQAGGLMGLAATAALLYATGGLSGAAAAGVGGGAMAYGQMNRG